MARLTLALSPATLPKMGSVYDIALAAAVLSAQRKNPWERLEKTVLLGELSLDGRVRPVRGVLPAVLAAKRDGWPAVVVPVDNLAEASLVDGIDVWGVRTLGQLQSWLGGSAGLDRAGSPPRPPSPEPAADLADVVGQAQARFAVEVAAAGAHHLMLTGPPGVGKTMLAQRLPGLLPRAVGQRVAGGHRDPLGGRTAVRRHAADHPAAVRGAAPQFHRRGTRRRRLGDGPPGRGQPGAPRSVVPGRVRRDQRQRAGSIANTVGRRRDSPRPPRRGRVLPGPLPAGAGRQPVPLRAGGSAGLHLRGGGQTALSGQALRAAAGSGGPAGADESGARRRNFGRRRRVDGTGARPGGDGARRGRRALAAARVPHQRRSQRAAAAAKVPPQQRRNDSAAHRAGPGAAQHPGRRSHTAGRVEPCRFGRPDQRPGSTRSPPR